VIELGFVMFIQLACPMEWTFDIDARVSSVIKAVDVGSDTRLRKSQDSVLWQKTDSVEHSDS
jgi:hypothetical protein